jgi:DNA-binding protein H-NS
MELNDLTTMTLPKLRVLQARVEKEVARRERTSKDNLIKKMKEIVREAGFSLQEFIPGVSPTTAAVASKPKRGKKQAPEKKKATPKYCHPSNRNLCWNGHGRKPTWFINWLAGGGSTSALENAAQIYAKASPSFQDATVSSPDNPPTDAHAADQ